jgi:predicted nucleotidyltransferase
MKINEEQFTNWTKPAFENERDRADAAKSIVEDAVKDHSVLKNLSINIFPKGSYANNTNVRRDSDIDIAVELENLIALDFFENTTFEDTGLKSYTGISKYDFKSHLLDALSSKFGSNFINSSGNKVFKIRGSEKILNADIIPCTSYWAYYKSGPIKGIQLILNKGDGKKYNNFPDQQLKYGVHKNNNTGRRYKRVVRIMKNARNQIVESTGNSNSHSFMIESLAYNVPNEKYLEDDNWRDIIKRVCYESWQYLKNEEPEKEYLRWFEVNDYKFLFHPNQKWSRVDAKNFVLDIYNLINN